MVGKNFRQTHTSYNHHLRKFTSQSCTPRVKTSVGQTNEFRTGNVHYAYMSSITTSVRLGDVKSFRN